MKNKFLFVIFLLFLISFSSKVFSKDIFNFNVTEIEILENGNIFKGYNGGEVLTDDGISIYAESFEYNKLLMSLVTKGNVKFIDKNKDITITADEIIYLKNEEKIISEGRVKFNDNKKKLIINAERISYFKNKEEIFAEENVDLIINKENIKISTDKITFLKNENKFVTSGETKAFIKSKYVFESENVTFLQDKMRLYSANKTNIKDNKNSLFELSSFEYDLENELLKGTHLNIVEDYNLPEGESDKYYFENGFFDFKNRSFISGNTRISLKKNTFDKSENDPRIYSVSSSHENEVTTLKKAVFTSCKKNDKCPPWRIEADQIIHDKLNKQLIYDNSILKLYDIPVFYFPKFFHPDPTVKRQSGLLIPKLNNSNILGSSISVPYFHVISENKDLTVNPIIFSKDIQMIQSEYREENKSSSFIADIGVVSGYKSSITNQRKNINHFFGNFKKNLNFDKFLKSDLNIFIERVSKDTYLKIFKDNLSESRIKPQNPDVLKSGLDLSIEHSNYSLTGGVEIYEDLTKLNNDKYQFVLPYYNFYQNPISNSFGSLNFTSTGNNVLDNTNNVKSRIINDLNFKTNYNIFKNYGLKNNLNFYFKNLNSVGKNINTYKSSPQVELQSLIEINSELPLIKRTKNGTSNLIPRVSIRLNPGDMKNHASTERKVNADNIFNINRLALNDSFESGNSLTYGIDFENKRKNSNDNLVKIRIASVLRDNEEVNIPNQTSLNKKNSNFFGSIDYNPNNFLNIDYNFALDKNLNEFKYNSIGLDLSLNNFITEFNFIEEETVSGNTNVFENLTRYNLNKNNSFSFKTRRNREINLTEYYDLVYEYQNDCLTAGVKFNKTYYEDRDLKPSKNLMFTISFYPLTTIEQSIK